MISCCTGIGSKCSQRLASLGVESVRDLQQSDVTSLADEFGPDMATTLLQLSRGVDPSPVVITGQAQVCDAGVC